MHYSCKESEAASIAYERAGSGPPIVFVHGLTYDRRMWRPLIDRLKDDYTCVALDLPGHGKSPDAKTYDLDAVMQNIHDVVETLELAEPIVVGHSIGALLAVFYAAHYSTAGIVTSDQTLRSIPFHERLHSIREQVSTPAFPHIWRSIESGLGIELIPQPNRALVEAASNPRQDVVLGYWREPLETQPTVLQQRLIDVIRCIDAPFTAVFGEDVPADYAPWLHALVPQCDIVVFPDSGHFPHLVDVDRFAREVSAVARTTAAPGV